MAILCDFCGKGGSDRKFMVASELNSEIHICEVCVLDTAKLLRKRKVVKAAIEETPEKKPEKRMRFVQRKDLTEEQKNAPVDPLALNAAMIPQAKLPI